jgi:hypothetical protein
MIKHALIVARRDTHHQAAQKQTVPALPKVSRSLPMAPRTWRKPSLNFRRQLNKTQTCLAPNQKKRICTFSLAMDSSSRKWRWNRRQLNLNCMTEITQPYIHTCDGLFICQLYSLPDLLEEMECKEDTPLTLPFASFISLSQLIIVIWIKTSVGITTVFHTGISRAVAAA